MTNNEGLCVCICGHDHLTSFGMTPMCCEQGCNCKQLCYNTPAEPADTLEDAARKQFYEAWEYLDNNKEFQEAFKAPDANPYPLIAALLNGYARQEIQRERIETVENFIKRVEECRNQGGYGWKAAMQKVQEEMLKEGKNGRVDKL